MNNMVVAYCKHYHIPTFSLFSAAFNSGIPTSEIMSDSAICFKKAGRIYLDFRHYPRYDLDLAGIQSILLVRDPRDMLVSWYYSISKSHVIPKNHPSILQSRQKAAQMSVDEFALEKANNYLKSFKLYRKKLPTETLSTYLYEDIIYNKKPWLQDLVKKLQLPLNNQLINKVVNTFDIFPDKEDQTKHIRWVHPGNYKTRFKPETIEQLNEILREFLFYYNYI